MAFAYTLRSYDDEMDLYEDQYYQEAMLAFKGVVKFEHEAFAKCIAYQVLECYSGATDIFNALGLERRHAHILVGQTKQFWKLNNGEPDYDVDE